MFLSIPLLPLLPSPCHFPTTLPKRSLQLCSHPLPLFSKRLTLQTPLHPPRTSLPSATLLALVYPFANMCPEHAGPCGQGHLIMRSLKPSSTTTYLTGPACSCSQKPSSGSQSEEETAAATEADRRLPEQKLSHMELGRPPKPLANHYCSIGKALLRQHSCLPG